MDHSANVGSCSNSNKQYNMSNKSQEGNLIIENRKRKFSFSDSHAKKWRDLKSNSNYKSSEPNFNSSENHEVPVNNTTAKGFETILISDESEPEVCEVINVSPEVIVIDDCRSENFKERTNDENEPRTSGSHTPGDDCILASYLVLSVSSEELFYRFSAHDFLFKEFGSENLNLLKCFCLICNTGTGGVNNFLQHIVGKNHRKKLSSHAKKDNLMNFAFCNLCKQIILFPDNNVNGLKRSSGPVKDLLFPPATVNKQKESCPNSNSKYFYLLIQDLKGFDFKDIFNELLLYCRDQAFNLAAIYFKPEKQTAMASFLKRKDFDNIGSNSVFIQKKGVEASRTQFEKFCIDTSETLTWKDGELSPMVSDLFSSKVRLENSIHNSLYLMAAECQSFHPLALQISRDLRRILGNAFKVHGVEFFGSRITGLSYADSDFDIALLLDPFNKKAPSPRIRMVSKFLLKSPQFEVVRVIEFAKVPIVRLIHNKTKSKCDVSINNLNGVYNSRLLRFYLSYDERVKWLVVAVKTWASTNLIHGSFRFTSYALFWMVLYVLMQPEYSVVPPVSLLEKTPSQDRLLCPESNISLSLDIDRVRRSHANLAVPCQLTEIALLKEIFNFYSRLNTTLAIDPWTGRRCHRNEVIGRLINPRNPEYYKIADKINKYSMILLDPINGGNICPGIKQELVSFLRSLSSNTVKLLSRFT